MYSGWLVSTSKSKRPPGFKAVAAYFSKGLMTFKPSSPPSSAVRSS